MYMKTVIDKLKAICCCCGLFMSVEESSTLNTNTKLILKSLSFGLIMLSDIDSCGIIDRKLRFYKQYIIFVRNSKCLNHHSTNKLSWASWQLCLPALDSLSMAEEAAIACDHPITSILKIRPNRGFYPAAYHAIKRHVVLLLQNPSPFLSLLSSPKIAVHN